MMIQSYTRVSCYSFKVTRVLEFFNKLKKEVIDEHFRSVIHNITMDYEFIRSSRYGNSVMGHY